MSEESVKIDSARIILERAIREASEVSYTWGADVKIIVAGMKAAVEILGGNVFELPTDGFEDDPTSARYGFGALGGCTERLVAATYAFTPQSGMTTSQPWPESITQATPLLM